MEQSGFLNRRKFVQKSSKAVLAFGTGAMFLRASTARASSGEDTCIWDPGQCSGVAEITCPCADPNDSACKIATCGEQDIA